MPSPSFFKKIASLLLFFGSISFLLAQSAFSGYPFLNLSANKITVYDTTHFAPFIEKMKQLREFQDRQVHILHIGDSHIQADMFTGEVRNLFAKDSRFKVASRGFSFPYSLAQTNTPFDYQVSYEGDWEGQRSVIASHQSDWGLAGITASTTDPRATFTFQPSADKDYSVSIVKVFFAVGNPNSLQPILKLEKKSKNRISATIKKKGVIEFHLEKPVRSFTIGLEARSEEQKSFDLQGLWVGNQQPGMVYSASGANGAKVSTYFRCERFHRDLTLLNPDLLVISLGTNDAFYNDFTAVGFAQHLTRMLQEVRATLPDLPVLLTTPGDSYKGNRKPNPKNETARKIIHQIAKKRGCAVWDFYETMGGFRSIEAWRKQRLAQPDMLHLTQSGYKLQGQLFYQALLEVLD